MRRKLLPYYGVRKSKIDMIVLHAVAFDVKEAIKSFENNEVSSHYVIAEDGEIWQLVGEKHRARHAGVSYWRGVEDVNSHSIGIEFCSKTLGQKKFRPEQIKSGIELIKKLMKKYKIRPENIVGHSDIAPTRKPDPGKAFFWRELAEENIGFWYKISDYKKINDFSVAELLEIIGYDVMFMLQPMLFVAGFYRKKLQKSKKWQNWSIISAKVMINYLTMNCFCKL